MDLPRETTTLDGFEAWDRRLRAPEGQRERVAFLSIRSDGSMGMNQAAYEMLGSPSAVQMMFDPKLRRVGVKPVERDSERAVYSSYYPLDRSSDVLPCRTFCEHYGIPLGEARRYTPKLIDGVLVVDL